MERPTGVTVLAILYVLAAVFFFLAAAVSGYLVQVASTTQLGEIPYAELFFAFSEIFFSITGTVWLITAYGLWKGRGWGWWLAVIFTAFGLISSLLSLPKGVVGIVVLGAILYYLTRRHVREFFGV